MVMKLTIKQLINKLKKLPSNYLVYTIAGDIVILDEHNQPVKHDIKTQIGSFEIDYEEDLED